MKVRENLLENSLFSVEDFKLIHIWRIISSARQKLEGRVKGFSSFGQKGNFQIFEKNLYEKMTFSSIEL